MAAELQRRQRCKFTTKYHHPSSSASEDLQLSGDHTSRRCLLHPSASASKDLQRLDDHTSHRHLQSSAASDLRLSGDHASRRRCRSRAEKSSSSPILPSIAMDQPDSRPRRSDSRRGSTAVDNCTLEVSTTMFDDAEHALACVLEEFDAIDHSIEHKLSSMHTAATPTAEDSSRAVFAQAASAVEPVVDFDASLAHKLKHLGNFSHHAPTAERTQPRDDIGRGEVVSGGLHDRVILGSAAPPATPSDKTVLLATPPESSALVDYRVAVEMMNSLPSSLWAHLGAEDGSFMLGKVCCNEIPSPESADARATVGYHAPTAERTQPRDGIGRGEVASGGLYDRVILPSAAPTKGSAPSTALWESAAPPTNIEPSKSVALAATLSTAEILPSRAGNSDKLRIHGNRALKQRRFADAIELYTLSLAANPGNKAALLNRSMARAAIECWDESIADSSLYLDTFGTDAIALYHRGFAKMMRNHGTHDIEGALVCFHQALSLSGSRTELIALLLNEIDRCTMMLLESAYDTPASHRITRSSNMSDVGSRAKPHKTSNSLDGPAALAVGESSRASVVDHRTHSRAPAVRTIGKPPSIPASVSAVSIESSQDSRDSQPVPLPQAQAPSASKPKRRKPRRPSKQLAAARYKQRAAKRRAKE